MNGTLPCLIRFGVHRPSALGQDRVLSPARSGGHLRLGVVRKEGLRRVRGAAKARRKRDAPAFRAMADGALGVEVNRNRPAFFERPRNTQRNADETPNDTARKHLYCWATPTCVVWRNGKRNTSRNGKRNGRRNERKEGTAEERAKLSPFGGEAHAREQEISGGVEARFGTGAATTRHRRPTRGGLRCRNGNDVGSRVSTSVYGLACGCSQLVSEVWPAQRKEQRKWETPRGLALSRKRRERP